MPNPKSKTAYIIYIPCSVSTWMASHNLVRTCAPFIINIRCTTVWVDTVCGRLWIGMPLACASMDKRPRNNILCRLILTPATMLIIHIEEVEFLHNFVSKRSKHDCLSHKWEFISVCVAWYDFNDFQIWMRLWSFVEFEGCFDRDCHRVPYDVVTFKLSCTALYSLVLRFCCLIGYTFCWCVYF